VAGAARRPLALGIALGGLRREGDAARALARVERAEALGLHSVWLPEGHFAPGAMPSPLVALAAFAARTRRLRLGTTSLLLPLRPPLVVAEEVATLDRLSNGRVWLGLGRGFRAPLFEAFGVPAAEKRDRFDAALDAILAAWRSGAARPAQRPHPPLLVAAFGRLGLAQAARRGLPYLASPLESLDALCENFAFHRERLPPGVDAGALPVAAIRAVHVARDAAEAARVRAALAAEAEGVSRALPAALARAGGERTENRALVGTAAEVLELLGCYRERLGLDLLIARGGVPSVSEAEADAALERLAGEVLPRLG
jgi:alkanesulfonate monooxygenase SsuD/methylene tetrahydromethanopterin reductase-like flavin-dependent oxidoreductase (luciferase family)